MLPWGSYPFHVPSVIPVDAELWLVERGGNGCGVVTWCEPHIVGFTRMVSL